MVISVAVGGFHDDNPDDPVWTVGASPIDRRVFPDGLADQDRREDLQVLAFLFAAGASGALTHPVGVSRPERDPPDRVITSPAGAWGCELTELTIQDVRRELAPVRRFGRTLAVALEADPRYDHLRGRLVCALYVPQNQGAAIEDSLSSMLVALEQDKGCVGDVQIATPPRVGDTLPDRGIYGLHGEFVMTALATGVPGVISVSAESPMSIHRSEALQALAARVADKDVAGNDALLITCGLPDKQGYACPLDEWLFNLLCGELRDGRPVLASSPVHLQTVVLQSWTTGAWIRVHETEGAPF